jgi:hypothetical protein
MRLLVLPKPALGGLIGQVFLAWMPTADALRWQSRTIVKPNAECHSLDFSCC